MAFLDKLNKMAKTIEDKTADAIEMSNYNAAITAGENGFTMDIRRIGEFYYEFFYPMIAMFLISNTTSNKNIMNKVGVNNICYFQ